MNSPDNITIISGCGPRGQVVPGKYYAKLWQGTESVEVDFPYLHRHHESSVSSISDLSAVLHRLENDPASCVIRGTAKPETFPICHRRSINFDDIGHHWVCLDFDSVEGDVEPQQVVQKYLPKEFHNASFHWQYSGSQGFKLGTRLHVWFWVDRLVDSSEWNLWLWSHGVDQTKKGNDKFLLLVDPALFRTVQPHITANPIIIGIPDPVSIRSGFWHGCVDVVPFQMGPYKPSNLIRKAVNACGSESPPPITPAEWQARQKGVIGRFNLTHHVGDILARNGYLPVADRYLHPYSTSGLPDTVINSGTHAYAFSPNNPLYEMGFDRATGEVLNRNHDAFDVYCILEHGGNERKALRYAAAMMAFEGIPNG